MQDIVLIVHFTVFLVNGKLYRYVYCHSTYRILKKRLSYSNLRRNISVYEQRITFVPTVGVRQVHPFKFRICFLSDFGNICLHIFQYHKHDAKRYILSLELRVWRTAATMFNIKRMSWAVIWHDLLAALRKSSLLHILYNRKKTGFV